jgi:two-component system cell cycle response regulator CpdR
MGRFGIPIPSLILRKEALAVSVFADMRRILIVDDEGGIRSLLKWAFTKSGYEVSTAANGREAIELFDSRSFDVMLSDVKMPGMSGHELVRSVVARYPGVRCVLMSGYDDLACEGCGQAPRPCTLLSKPFDPIAAVAAIEGILSD